jgi:hypothetical protein
VCQAKFFFVLSSTVDIKKLKGCVRNDSADHALDAPLNKVVTDIGSARVEMMEPHVSAVSYCRRFDDRS